MRNGQAIQAAAGWQQELLTPLGALFTAGALVGGWQIGSVLGEVWKKGHLSMEKEHPPSDAEEFVAFGGAVAGSVLSWQWTEEMIQEHGLEKVVLWGSGIVAFVVVGKAIRERV